MAHRGGLSGLSLGVPIHSRKRTRTSFWKKKRVKNCFLKRLLEWGLIIRIEKLQEGVNKESRARKNASNFIKCQTKQALWLGGPFSLRPSRCEYEKSVILSC